MADSPAFGTLFVVATPLGNLQDITFRAVSTLKEVDLIAAEDTRHSRKLLNHYNISTKLVSCHEHNEKKKIPRLIDDLKEGKNIALISDAGTPTISDPGYKLVAAVAKENIDVIPIPGCSAAIAVLSVSGLPTDSFHFIGFLPRKKQKQAAALESLKDMTATLIFYESPKRIKNLIRTAIQILGDRQACLAREITKIHEEYTRGSLSSILEVLEQKPSVKGEFTLMVQGATKKKNDLTDSDINKIVADELNRNPDIKTRDLAKKLSKQYQLPKTRIYDLIIQLQGK